jgi:hypothetical protein
MTTDTISAVELAEAFNANAEHVWGYCCAETETLKDREGDTREVVAAAFHDWVEARSGDEWESYAAGWTAFVDDVDKMVAVTLLCGCHPKAKCGKCGPVKGKVRGTVYLRRIDDDRYFISPEKQ